jgi:hypothetical protein
MSAAVKIHSRPADQPHHERGIDVHWGDVRHLTPDRLQCPPLDVLRQIRLQGANLSLMNTARTKAYEGPSWCTRLARQENMRYGCADLR